MARYDPYDQENEETIQENEVTVLLRDKFWSKIRGDLYKKMAKGHGGKIQWEYLTGIRSRDASGKRIKFTDKNYTRLEGIVQYLQSSEGRDALLEIGVMNPPEDPDSLVEILQGSKSDRQIKKEELNLFLKYKEKILQYLAGSF